MVVASSADALGGGGPKQNGEVYHGSQDPAAISADGTHLAFTASATNLSLQDQDAGYDVFTRNLDTATTMLVSIHPATSFDLGPSIDPSISADGRYVAFTSDSSHLDPADTDNYDDVYVRDTQTGSLTLVSRASGVNGAKQNDASTDYSGAMVSITPDGRYVAFRSSATNLSPDATDGTSHIYVRDLQSNTTVLVDRATGASGAPGNGYARFPSISADGRYVAFDTFATNFDPADTDGNSDVYVRDLQSNTTTLVGRANGASGAKAVSSVFGTISGDGRQVAFLGTLQGGPPENFDQLYVRDLNANTTTLVSRATGATGVRANDWIAGPAAITPDGRYVAFSSVATNLSPDDSDATEDVFVRDLQSATTTLVSRATGVSGVKGNSDSLPPTLSSDGRYIAFPSAATNLSPDDTDTLVDLYVRDMQANVTSLESRATPGYVRPRGASPTRLSLVPAYPPCTAPDRVHGAPLAFSSCSNPRLASGTLTVGTPDANGAAANFAGYVNLTTIVGQPRCCDTDVKINASLTDVRRADDLSDYAGQLQLQLPLRITDKVNDVDGVQPGTMTDYTFKVTIPCAATSNTSVGSTCSVATSANVVLPGAVLDGRRTIWALGQVAVYDGGPDGDVNTPADNTLFAKQGVFVP